MTSADAYGPLAALAWSVQAMLDATDRVNMVAATDLPRAFSAMGEAVWWITIVDDSLKANYRAVYDDAASNSVPSPACTLLGLRSVRNRIGREVELADFIYPIASRPDLGDGRITAWAWKHVPPPRESRRRKRFFEGALRAHGAYGSAVVDGGQGGNVVFTFMLATGFLRVVHERAVVSEDPDTRKPRSSGLCTTSGGKRPAHN